ncbi:MAG: hypothetical protein P8165_02110 [Deltaproteobacteria bacterium]
MYETSDSSRPINIIATIENRENPSQTVEILYLEDQNAFVSAGIQHLFGEKELLIPAHLVVSDFELMGTIVAVILEKLSRARDMESTFTYASRMDVMGKTYALEPYGEYIRVSSLGRDA